MANEVYPPWKGSYINYEGLKKFLKEDSVKDGSNDKKARWDDSDESKFVEELDKELEGEIVPSGETNRYGSSHKGLGR